MMEIGNTIYHNEPEFMISGYRIYVAEQKRRTVRNDLPSLCPDLPEKKYDVIYADRIGTTAEKCNLTKEDERL